MEVNVHRAAALALLAAPAAHARTAPPTIESFTVRPGYKVTLAVDAIREARFLESDGKGALFVSHPRRGEITALRDEDGDGFFEKRTTFLSGHPTAHGMHFKDGWLWFTQTGAIHKARDTDGDDRADDIVTVIPDGQLPQAGGHWWRAILVTDDALYTSIGDTGNINDETNTERQKIWRFSLDGKNKTLFSSGVRNTEKLRLRPGTSEVWGVDHGSDWFGRELGESRGKQPVTDYNPPDEFNLYVEGAFYGHPFIVGSRIPRYEYMERRDIVDLADKTVVPEWSFGAHWAANGWDFLDPAMCGLAQEHAWGRGMPADHAGDAFVACRGSWNRTERDGYRVVRILFDEHAGKPYGMLEIVSTLSGDKRTVHARPVDCHQLKDGSVLFSCDETNRVYRISHDPQAGQ